MKHRPAYNLQIAKSNVPIIAYVNKSYQFFEAKKNKKGSNDKNRL